MMQATASIEITEEFAQALAILESGGNMFLTGKAGTGKSTLIRHFMASTERSVVVAAPTGIAALNVGGYTLHRLFGFRPTTTYDDVISGEYRPGSLARVLKSVDTLIIDEASMVRADVFDMIAVALERYGPRPGMPFGGVQIVLVGDLFQLPPVVVEAEQAHFASRYPTPYFFSADNFDRAMFPTVQLTRIFRQAGDPALTGILNALREGLLLKDSQVELNRRTNPFFSPPEGELWLTLAPTNSVVTARNRQRLDALPGEAVVSHASETGDLGAFERPVERELHLKVGAQIMMLTNDASDRWVNGTLGTVAAIELDRFGGVISVVVHLADGSDVEVSQHTWEVTRPVVEGGRLRHEVVGTFTQLPFKLAWAITIHKSQGQTLDRLVVDLSGGTFAFGQTYVALSRCTSLQGLVLTRPVLPKDLKTDRRVLRFLRESTDQRVPTRRCSVAVLTVGSEGRQSRPRPVEIAVAFDDGSAISTLVNPQRDLADAASRFGITTRDVLLAPTLPDAWATIAAVVEGAVPVGVNTDEAMGFIDFELKRLGVVTSLPLGVDVGAGNLTVSERDSLRAPRALERARASLAIATRLGANMAAATAFEPFTDDNVAGGFLLTRDPQATAPSSNSAPMLAGLLRTSAVMSAILLDGARATEFPHNPDPGASLQKLITNRLGAAIRNSAGLPPELVDRISHIESLYGIDVWSTVTVDSSGDDSRPIDGILQPGARVCFTGSVHDPRGRFVDKAELEELVTAAGLRWSATVSKTRCEALIVAEIGTQSGKARTAKQYGKPVFSAAQFFDWLSRHHSK